MKHISILEDGVLIWGDKYLNGAFVESGRLVPGKYNRLDIIIADDCYSGAVSLRLLKTMIAQIEEGKGSENIIYYTCSRNGIVHCKRVKPGKCPICGKTLISHGEGID